MATTKIWDVSAHVSKLLAYVANKNKTTMEVERGTDDEEMRLAAEMLGLPSDHFATEEKKFVTGINCTPENAKRGTGSVHRVSKNVWEGRYTPTVNGKRIARNVYADSEEECEKKLEALIKEMKAEFGIR